MNDLQIRLDSMTPQQKLNLALDLYHSAWRLKAAWLRKKHPNLTEEEIQKKVKDIFLYAQS